MFEKCFFRLRLYADELVLSLSQTVSEISDVGSISNLDGGRYGASRALLSFRKRGRILVGYVPSVPPGSYVAVGYNRQC